MTRVRGKAVLESTVHRCQARIDFERMYDEKMEYYIGLVDQQSRMFRQGRVRAGRELDAVIREAKAEHERVAQALLRHSAGNN